MHHSRVIKHIYSPIDNQLKLTSRFGIGQNGQRLSLRGERGEQTDRPSQQTRRVVCSKARARTGIKSREKDGERERYIARAHTRYIHIIHVYTCMHMWVHMCIYSEGMPGTTGLLPRKLCGTRVAETLTELPCLDR